MANITLNGKILNVLCFLLNPLFYAILLLMALYHTVSNFFHIASWAFSKLPLQTFVQTEVLISILYWRYPNSWLFSVLSFCIMKNDAMNIFSCIYLSVFLVTSFIYFQQLNYWTKRYELFEALDTYYILETSPFQMKHGHVFGEWLYLTAQLSSGHLQLLIALKKVETDGELGV